MRVGPQFVHQHQMLWNLTKINHQELLLRLQLKELHSRFVSLFLSYRSFVNLLVFIMTFSFSVLSYT